MSYYNLHNPNSGLGDSWVAIVTDDKKVASVPMGVPVAGKMPEGSAGSVVDDDINGLWQKVVTTGRSLDAGKLQKKLEDSGFVICHDGECHDPNGVTCSTAGLLIAFENELTPEEEIKLGNLLRNISENFNDYLS